MRKHINSTDRFIDVNTGTLVLDTTPTEGSFNAVTSDGVAKAIAQGGGGGGGSYSAGNGVSISEGTISAKVDGSTIGFDASGNLKSLVGSDTELFYATINSTSVDEILEAVSAGKLPVVKDSSSIVYILSGLVQSGPSGFVDTAYFVALASIGTAKDVGFVKYWVHTESNTTTWTRVESNILPDYTSSDEGKVLGVVSDGYSGYTTGWVSVSSGGGSGAYIADFRGIGSMTNVQKSDLAAAIGAAASAGTPVFAKLDSIQGGDSHTPNARLLPLTDFYYSDISDFKFHFTAPFDWYDPEDSYAPHRGFNVVEFYNAEWASTPYPFSDTFYEASFTKMNPAPHR